MTLLFLLVAVIAGVGLTRTVLGQAASSRYLEEGRLEQLQVGHLSRPLQSVAKNTRALRISLEEPLRRVKEAESPLGTRTSELDNELLNASREVGEWLRQIERLGPDDLETMHDVGAHPEPVRQAFETEGYSFEYGRAAVFGDGRGEPLSARLKRMMDELDRVESALQTVRDPYR